MLSLDSIVSLLPGPSLWGGEGCDTPLEKLCCRNDELFCHVGVARRQIFLNVCI